MWIVIIISTIRYQPVIFWTIRINRKRISSCHCCLPIIHCACKVISAWESSDEQINKQINAFKHVECLYRCLIIIQNYAIELVEYGCMLYVCILSVVFVQLFIRDARTKRWDVCHVHMNNMVRYERHAIHFFNRSQDIRHVNDFSSPKESWRMVEQ